MSKNTTSSPGHGFDALNPWPGDIAGVRPTVRQLATGAVLFRQGDKTFGFFRLVSGRIRLIRVTPGGTEVPMHIARPGELLAEASLFSTQYHCDAVATKESEVLVYSKEEIVRQLKAQPDEMWRLAAEMARRVQGLRTQLEIRQIRSAPMRVLQALRLRCDASGCWKQDGTLKQFAEEIGLTHEALYRTLAKLEQDGRIIRSGNEFCLVSDK